MPLTTPNTQALVCRTLASPLTFIGTSDSAWRNSSDLRALGVSSQASAVMLFIAQTVGSTLIALSRYPDSIAMEWLSLANGGGRSILCPVGHTGAYTYFRYRSTGGTTTFLILGELLLV